MPHLDLHDVAVSCDSRAITNVSASSSVTIRARSSTGARLVRSGARSSGDRAFASGAKGRRFDSCRAHQNIPLRSGL